MTILSLLVAIVILGLLAYLISVLPIPHPFKVAAYVVLLIAAILWLTGMIPLR